MTTKEYLLKQLKQFIFSPSESAWLTPDQQYAIERKIDELDTYINECYRAQKRKQQARKQRRKATNSLGRTQQR